MAAVALLVTIPGVGERSAQNILAEIGTDMSVFATDKHLTSWAGQSPGNHQSAGKQRRGQAALRPPAQRLQIAQRSAHGAALATTPNAPHDASSPALVQAGLPGRV